MLSACAPRAGSPQRGPLMFAVIAALVLAACSRGPDTGSKPRADASAPRILLRGNGPEPDSLDPQNARSSEAQTILRDLCESLTSLAKDAGVAPGVATVGT